MKRFFTYLSVVILLFSSAPIFGQLDSLIPTGGVKEVLGSDQIIEMDAPLIGEVKITPSEPKAGEEVTVIAEIANNPERTDVTTEEAYLWYSIDEGKTWTKIDMEKTEDEKSFKGIIPAQSSGTKVLYYVQGIDITGSMATEMPGINLVWPPDPGGGKIPLLSQPLTDPDTDKSSLIDDIDILELKIGYDEKSIYGALKVQGKISPGTMSPIWMQLYAVAVINPDKGEDLAKLMDAGVVVVRGELLAGAVGGLIGLTASDFVIDKRIVGPDMTPGKAVDDKESGLSVYVDKDTWYFKINRNFSALKDNKSGRLKFVAIAGAVTSMEIATFTAGGGIGGGNVTRFLNAYLRSRSYTVK